MFLTAKRNILVKGQHFDEGCRFETDADTAAALLTTGKVSVAEDATKQPDKSIKKAKAE